MVDGDQLNVVVEPVIVQVAERNVEKYDVIPLFYDAAKAPPEQVSKQSIYNGLIRAHKFSNIGEISDKLTRLWNRDNPDRLAAAMLTALNNWRIDGAKTGECNEYEDYPEIKKRINKATGGPNGRLPAFFQFSKNGRRDKTVKRKKKRQWAAPNNSTMNRICKAFDDVGNMNMNMAGIPVFNWQMLLSEPCLSTRKDIVDEFCELDGIRVSLTLARAEESPAEKELLDSSDIVNEHIIYVLTQKYGSLEYCYPYIVKYLFAGENVNKASHKQTFWRIFGDMAVANLRENLNHCKVCAKCGAKIPEWATSHSCPKNTQKTFVCIDCGKTYNRTNSRQVRCSECQEHFRHSQIALCQKKSIEKKKRERERQFTSFLESRYKEM